MGKNLREKEEDRRKSNKRRENKSIDTKANTKKYKDPETNLKEIIVTKQGTFQAKILESDCDPVTLRAYNIVDAILVIGVFFRVSWREYDAR